MKKAMIVLVLLSALVGLASVVQATHDLDWTKEFWDQQDRKGL